MPRLICLVRLFLFFGFATIVAQPVSAKNLTMTVPFSAKKLDIILEVVDPKGNPLPEIPLNKMFAIKAVCAACDPAMRQQLQLIEFKAEMPAHNHGMISRPRISRSDEKYILIEGVKFHMPGHWQMRLKWALRNEEAQVAMSLNL